MLFTQGVDRRPRLSFEGDAYKLRLVSRSSFRDGPEAPPRWIELKWEPNGDSGRLIVQESLIPAISETPGPEPRWQGTVLDGKQFRFEYRPRPTPDRKREWVGAWPASDLLMPAAVRISYVRRGRPYQMVLPLQYSENSWSGRWFR